MLDWRRKLEDMVSEAADVWHSRANRLAMGGQFPPFYLYFQESEGKNWGCLHMIPESETPDAAWKLGDNLPYRCNLTRDQVRRRIRESVARLPLLPSVEV